MRSAIARTEDFHLTANVQTTLISQRQIRGPAAQRGPFTSRKRRLRSITVARIGADVGAGAAGPGTPQALRTNCASSAKAAARSPTRRRVKRPQPNRPSEHHISTAAGREYGVVPRRPRRDLDLAQLGARCCRSRESAAAAIGARQTRQDARVCGSSMCVRRTRGSVAGTGAPRTGPKLGERCKPRWWQAAASGQFP